MSTDTQIHANGRVRGRAVPELPLHTFKDSGVTVRLHKLSPMTGQEIHAVVERELADDKPRPPIVDVDYGQGKLAMPHEGDPVYQELLAAWRKRVNTIANDRLFKVAALLAVELTVGERERTQIDRTKKYLRLAGKLEWQDDSELSQEENDQLFYMTHIACGSAEDLQEFYMAIATRSQPTEAAIERHKETFPGNLSGAVDLDV